RPGAGAKGDRWVIVVAVLGSLTPHALARAGEHGCQHQHRRAEDDLLSADHVLLFDQCRPCWPEGLLNLVDLVGIQHAYFPLSDSRSASATTGSRSSWAMR